MLSYEISSPQIPMVVKSELQLHHSISFKEYDRSKLVLQYIYDTITDDHDQTRKQINLEIYEVEYMNPRKRKFFDHQYLVEVCSILNEILRFYPADDSSSSTHGNDNIIRTLVMSKFFIQEHIQRHSNLSDIADRLNEIMFKGDWIKEPYSSFAQATADAKTVPPPLTDNISTEHDNMEPQHKTIGISELILDYDLDYIEDTMDTYKAILNHHEQELFELREIHRCQMNSESKLKTELIEATKEIELLRLKNEMLMMSASSSSSCHSHSSSSSPCPYHTEVVLLSIRVCFFAVCFVHLSVMIGTLLK